MCAALHLDSIGPDAESLVYDHALLGKVFMDTREHPEAHKKLPESQGLGHASVRVRCPEH